MALGNGKPSGPPRSPHTRPAIASNGDPSAPHRTVSGPVPGTGLAPVKESYPAIHQGTEKTSLQPAPTSHAHRASSPPAFSREDLPSTASVLSHTTSRPARLEQRHTLEVPKVIATRNSADGRQENNASADGAAYTSGRFSPNTPTKRRGSLQLARRVTRSIHSHSDMQLDQVPQDEDAARWTELVKAKRAKKSRVDTDDDRVVIGKKVDESHQNYVRMYNMLTGIRFVVSRIHAKMDRELNDADFLQAQKYSFDITGGELTPSAKYDFKFKDYAPWVFRHIRIAFGIDPADYLVSLTAKYILSELGSPGKSGSFFYFSRDYKYIIKTIHHAEHKFLRRILKDYYRHVRENPNTLLSQFYGLHRVKLPYGKKIHFIVMNNLFPPHRDIHRTFDLKGSTIGRDFKEEDLEKNPRATLKDLNWLRRNLHLEFGPTKKEAFVAQMQKDVAFLQRSKIMDYSLLVGIHDLEKGNEENLRDKTLQVFQPGGEKGEEQQVPGQLTMTPSKMESAKRARELRDAVKKERPIPLAQTADKMPDEAHRKGFYFYQDDGGFQATHEDDSPGEEIYYLGIIDCLTKYNYVKKAEHFWKGMGGHESQISPIPPERYGERFVKFIAGITMSREQAEKVRLSTNLHSTAGIVIPPGIEGTLDDPRLSSSKTANPPGTDKVMEEAELEAERSRRHGHSEAEAPDRTISAVRSPGEGIEAATLPVIGEAAESASNTSKTPRITPTHSYESLPPHQPVVGNANMPAEAVGEMPPPTPPKTDGTAEARDFDLGRGSWGGGPPPTPPKDAQQRDRRSRAMEKTLPLPPEIQATKVFSRSPSRLVEEEMEKARARVSG
ncbi:SAICAR synthase-like protein [Teratosphaeria nubilosa]|uniref:1-phosphatidylinositol-4-phosphate 5-kinase n=1 Tax=Teratosphaeria nubilosa TaxID=161662 RepID=A0A6G1L7K9_9PEZI|nr:SAICAR synthase-like protein [Teratosphaeria nubilosa]